MAKRNPGPVESNQEVLETSGGKIDSSKIQASGFRILNPNRDEAVANHRPDLPAA
jgi:hypothetical protein